MKTQAELIQEAVTNAAEGCAIFNAKMVELFPVYIALARPRKLLGDNVEIEFANVSNRSECSSGILMNASGHMRFMMQLNEGVNTVANSFDIDLLTWHHQARSVLKFRRIKGKTPAEALQKLAVWFEKNQDIIKAI